MQLTYLHDDGNTYTVTTVEHIEHAFEYDGECYTPTTELFYGFELAGDGVDYASLDETPTSPTEYQCWPSEDDALVEGLKQLLKQLTALDRKREKKDAA